MRSHRIKFLFLFVFIFLFSLSSIVAGERFGYNYLEGQLNVPQDINYSTLNVNNSQYLRGLTPQEVADLYQELWEGTNGSDIYYQYGNVGIGTASPQNKLNVIGDGNFTNNLTVNENIFLNDNLGEPFLGIGTSTPLNSKNRIRVLSTGNANLLMETSNSGAFSSFQMKSGSEVWEFGVQGTFASGNLILRPSLSGNTDMFNFASTGEFGIGTSTPQNKLDVSGGQVIGSSYAGVNTAPTDGLLVEGNVGIGTTTPDEALHVVGIIKGVSNGGKFEFYEDDVAEADAFFKVTNGAGSTGVFAPLFWSRGNRETTPGIWILGDGLIDTGTIPVVQFQARSNNGVVSTRPLFSFQNFAQSGSGFTAMQILANGNVGIGITAPNEQLEITENFRFPTTTSTAGIIYQDANRFIHSFAPSGSNGRNVFIGKNSGSFTTSFTTGNTGAENTAIGEDSLNSMTTGYRNVVLGFNAGTSVTTGFQNNIIGAYAGNSMTTGNFNNIQGYFAGGQITGGSQNTAIGESSSRYNQVGNGNTALGYRALFGASGQSHNGNLGVGYQAGGAITTGANNVFLGYQVGLASTSTGSSNILIGDGVDASSATVSNELNIGDTIYGDLANNLIGINTATPQNTLNVVGDLNVTGTFYNPDFFIPQYIFSHTNETIPVLGADTWTNVTFSQEVSDINYGISHNATDSTNQTFTITESGIYEINFDFDFEDTSGSPSTVEVASRLIYLNGSEISGSIIQTEITRLGVHIPLAHSFLLNVVAGDSFIFQFIASDSDVVISTHGTYGDNPESATIIIKKIANLPN